MSQLDSSDLTMLDALAKYGPRNVTEVARQLGIPAETLRKRLKNLRSQFFLRFNANLYHTNLGLKKAVVFAEAIPGYEDLLFNSLKTNDFWIYVCRCYGMFEGCVGIFPIPEDHCAEFEQFLGELEKLAIARNVQFFWSTCFQSVQSRCTWFDQNSQTWNFQWDKWIEEIKSEEIELPYTLVDPESFPIKADEMDLFILKELEKDATVRFTKIAEMLDVPPQLVRYHYRNHLIERGLIEDFQVTIFHFGRAVSEFLFFIFNFDNAEKLAKFTSSLLDKPFAVALGKILDRNALYGYLYLPKSEFRRFLDALSKLIQKEVLQSYQYVIQDLSKSSRDVIPYQLFKDDVWIYDHDKHMRNLRELVKKSAPDMHS